MKRCPECGARIKNRSAVRCPACTAPLPAPRPSVGKHEIQSKSGKKPLIVTDRRISSEIDNKAKRKRKTPEKASEERLPNTDAKRVSGKPPRDDSLYDGYYDDVLPTDTGEYRQGLDTRTMKNIAILLAAMLVIVTICVVALLYL